MNSWKQAAIKIFVNFFTSKTVIWAGSFGLVVFILWLVGYDVYGWLDRLFGWIFQNGKYLIDKFV